MKRANIVTLIIIFVLLAAILAGAIYLGGKHRLAGDETEPHSHDFGEWSAVSEPTCTESGRLERKCSVCGEIEVRYSESNGHLLSDWENVDGVKYVKICTVCGNEVAEQEIYTDISEGARFMRTEDRKSYKLDTVYSFESDIVVIPSEHNGLKVTEIGESALENCDKIDTLILPETITTIGKGAFMNSSLRCIYIPESVTEIHSSAFYGCKNLESIILPNSLKSISSSLFSNCTNLTEVYIPEGVTYIEDYAFSQCSSLAEIRLPESATQLGNSIFSGCESLRKVSLPNSLTVMPASIFNACRSLESIYIPDGVVLLENGCFAGCTSLTEIELPEGLQTMEFGIFSGCASLKSIVIPEKIRKIETMTFAYCTALESIYIPASVNSISSTAFIHTGDNLRSISVSADNPIYSTDGRTLFAKINSDTKKVWLGASDGVIPKDKSITSIAACAFQGREKLTEIFIPKNIVSIGDSAFEDCPNVKSITCEGTVAEWNAMKRGFDWFRGSDIDVVHCSDGDTKLVVERSQPEAGGFYLD